MARATSCDNPACAESLQDVTDEAFDELGWLEVRRPRGDDSNAGLLPDEDGYAPDVALLDFCSVQCLAAWAQMEVLLT